MRIFSSRLCVLAALLFNNVMADDPSQDGVPEFTFEGYSFLGQWIDPNQTSVFDHNLLKQQVNKTFSWTRKHEEAEVLQVDLMNNDTHAIASWCPGDGNCERTDGFSVQPWNKTGGYVTLDPPVIEALADYRGAVLFFRIDWQFKNGNPAGGVYSSWSQKWAVAEGASAVSSVYSEHAYWMTAGGPVVSSQGPAPTSIILALVSGTTASGLASSTSPTEKSGGQSQGLTTGAIVGIVVGCVGGLVLVSLAAGCLCFRRRRRRDAGGDRGGSRGVKDTIAEKEARATILDRDQPDTPYSEQNSQHTLQRGLGLAGRYGSGADLGIGQAMSGERSTESLHTVADVNDRNSGVYSSLGGAAARSAHGTPVIGSGAFASGPSSPLMQPHTPSMSVHERSPAMDSPVPRSSSQLDRSLSPYRDNAGQHDYGQHHVIGDGTDRAHQEQEHSGDDTARVPSSLYSSNPLEETQPISPGSPKDNGGAAGGASSQPHGHSRTNTPSGIAQQYAHLVEDGMTDAEIRRLEEEERALDEAIEQAGSTGRQW